MDTIINGWLSIWLYVIVGIGIYLGIKLYQNCSTYSKLNIICTLGVIVLVLHVLEEWVIPGGLHYLYNITGQSQNLSGYPMSRLTDMLTNFGGIILGFIAFKSGGFKKPTAIVVLFISIMEVVVHISISFNSYFIFHEYGQTTLYAPGLITALMGFLPISIILIKMLLKDKPNRKQAITGLIGAIAVCLICIDVPEKILAKEDNNYYFTNRGYYEQFSEQYESDHNVIYSQNRDD